MTDQDDVSKLPSWHDNLIYGLHLRGADPDRGVWRSELLLDIDYIVEWICGIDSRTKLRIAPATRTFHDVTNLQSTLDFYNDAYRQNINELSIAEITRKPVDANKEGSLGPYFEWSIEMNLPKDGKVTFGASAYSQILRANPVLMDEQRLSADDRTAMCCRLQFPDERKL